MLTPRDLDRAKTTGDRRRGGKRQGTESAFCGPKIATGAFHAIYLFFPSSPEEGRKARWMDGGLDPCRSSKIIRMPFEPFRHSLDPASKNVRFSNE